MHLTFVQHTYMYIFIYPSISKVCSCEGWVFLSVEFFTVILTLVSNIRCRASTSAAAEMVGGVCGYWHATDRRETNSVCVQDYSRDSSVRRGDLLDRVCPCMNTCINLGCTHTHFHIRT